MTKKTDKKILRRRVLSLLLAVVLLGSIGTIAAVQSGDNSVSTLSKMGSRGDEVRRIQQKLKSMGYYTGSVDGIYGTQTQSAVKKFQRDNGLDVDGIA